MGSLRNVLRRRSPLSPRPADHSTRHRALRRRSGSVRHCRVQQGRGCAPARGRDRERARVLARVAQAPFRRARVSRERVLRADDGSDVRHRSRFSRPGDQPEAAPERAGEGRRADRCPEDAHVPVRDGHVQGRRRRHREAVAARTLSTSTSRRRSRSASPMTRGGVTYTVSPSGRRYAPRASASS